MLPYRWIPKDSEVIAHPLGVVYTYQAGPRVAAVAYVGKANKASWHHSFIGRDPIAARAQKIQEFFSGLEASAKLKADRRAERNKPHDLQVGDIVINSWGWEQTNIDAYEVVGTSANYVSLQRVNRQINETGWLRGTSVPIPGTNHGEVTRHRAEIGGYVNFKYGSGRKWDGRPEHWTAYA